MAFCKAQGCGAEIAWVKLTSGKSHPVEGRTPETYYVREADKTTRPQLKIITREGAIISGAQARDTDMGTTRVEGWESHFATCVGARTFR